MPDDYAYINTRVRVMRKALLDGRLLESALAAGSYPEFLRVLSETPLAANLREATADGAGLPELDRALSQGLFATTQKVLGFADGKARREIETLLMRWDLVNLKTIARGVSAGRSPESIKNGLIPGGTLKYSSLESAASASDLLAAAVALGVRNPLAAVFRKAAALHQSNGDLLALEVALDQGYYAHLREVASDTSLKNYLTREIDVTNALMAKQAQMMGRAVSPEYFVSGGRLDAATFGRLATGEISGSPEISAIMEASTLAEAEALARKLLDKTARTASTTDPMGVGIILDFLRRKEVESAQLRLIGRGKYYGLPEEEIRMEVGA